MGTKEGSEHSVGVWTDRAYLFDDGNRRDQRILYIPIPASELDAMMALCLAGLVHSL